MKIKVFFSEITTGVELKLYIGWSLTKFLFFEWIGNLRTKSPIRKMFLEFPCLKQLNHLKNCWLEYSLYGLVLSTCYSEIKCQPPLQKKVLIQM